MSNGLKYYLLTKSVGLLLNVVAVFLPRQAATMGYKLHSEPRKGKLYYNNLPPILMQAKHETLFVDGVNCQKYIWMGNSEIILLIHGWESNSSRWQLLLPYLVATGKSVVALDAPAHGLSGGISFSVPKYANFINAACQNIQPSYIVGHSIGGAACVFYQYKFQNPYIKKIVLLAAPSDLQVLIDNFCKLLSLNQKLKKYLTTEFEQQLNHSVNDFSIAKFAGSINIPALVVHDRFDKVVSFDESQKIINFWREKQFIETKNLGHSLNDNFINSTISSYILK